MKTVAFCISYGSGVFGLQSLALYLALERGWPSVVTGLLLGLGVMLLTLANFPLLCGSTTTCRQERN